MAGKAWASSQQENYVDGTLHNLAEKETREKRMKKE